MPTYEVTDPKTGRKVFVPWDDVGTPDKDTIDLALEEDRRALRSPLGGALAWAEGLSAEFEEHARTVPAFPSESFVAGKLLSTAGRGFSAVSRVARRPVDYALGQATRLSGLALEKAGAVPPGVGTAAGESMIRGEATAGDVLERAVDALPTAKPSSLIDHIAAAAQGTHPVLRGAQKATAKTLGDAASDPTSLAPLGALAKFGRLGSQLQYVLSASFAGMAGSSALESAKEVMAHLSQGNIASEESAKAATDMLLSAGFAYLGGRGLKQGLSRDRMLAQVEALQREADLLRASGVGETPEALQGAVGEIAPIVRRHVRARAEFRAEQKTINRDKAERLHYAFAELANNPDPTRVDKLFGALRGENPGVDMPAPVVSPESQKALYAHIAESATAGRVDKWTALHAIEGLSRMLAHGTPQGGGRVIQAGNPLQGALVNVFPLEISERAALRAVFGRHFYATERAAELELRGERTARQKVTDVLSDALFDAPRALQASADLSATLRQGGPVTVWNFLRHPLRTVVDVATAVNAFRSPEAYRTIEQSLHDPHVYTDANGAQTTIDYARLADQSGLHRAMKVDPAATTARLTQEEFFQSTLAEKIPVVGEIVKGSERAYSVYLDQIRRRLFLEWDGFFRDSGAVPEKAPELWKGAAEAINALTGNSPLPVLKLGRDRTIDLNRAAPLMRVMFFAPRFFYSRLKLLKDISTAGHGYDPRVRVQGAKIMASYIGAYTALLAGLSQLVPGVAVETDPRSADFIKVRVGNTRFDVWSGLQQPVRFAAQMLAGQRKTAAGETKEIVGTPGWWARRGAKFAATGEAPPVSRGPFQDEALSVLASFAESKESPFFNLGADVLRGGRDLFGREAKFSPTERFRPFGARDVEEAARLGDPIFAAMAVAPANILGVGTQTYLADTDPAAATRREAEGLRPKKKRTAGETIAKGLRRDDRAAWEVKIRRALKPGGDEAEDKALELLLDAADVGYTFPDIEAELLGAEETEEEEEEAP